MTLKEKERKLTPKRLRETHTYDAMTGRFARIHHDAMNRPHSTKEPGMNTWNGYRAIKIDFVTYRAHRLAWLYFYGRWPKGSLDHINCNRQDNRISNLRESDHSKNGMNRPATKSNTSGYKGVSFDKRRNCWHASVGFKGKNISAGDFSTAKEASAAYNKKAIELFGDFARCA